MTGPAAREDPPDAWLIERVRKKEQGAFDLLYERYAGLVYRTSLRFAGGREAEAQEIAQEAWLRAVRDLERFRTHGSFGAWIGGIARNCGLEHVRRNARDPSAVGDPGDVAPDDPASGLDLERAFESLAPGFRAVLLLHDLYGYTHEEIGERLEISAGTSRSQLSRARRRMRALLGGATDDT